MFGNTLFMKMIVNKSVLNRIVIVVDSFLFSLLVVLPFNILLHYMDHPVIFVMILIGVCGIVLTIRIRYGRAERQKRIERRNKQIKIDQLMLKCDDSLSELTGYKKFIFIRKSNPDRFDILEAIRQEADAIGVLSKKLEFSHLVQSYAPHTAIYDVDEILHMTDPNIVEEKMKPQSRGVYRIRFNKYLLLGLILMFASFVFRYKIYFHIISCICMFFATISGAFGHSYIHEKWMIFLDKKGDR